MRIILLGGTGFLGTNLVKKLSEIASNEITIVDKHASYFEPIAKMHLENVDFKESLLDEKTDYGTLLENQDVLYHLLSTTIPTTSNHKISEELNANIVVTTNILEACVSSGIKKVVFISSGGTVYGKVNNCPIKESYPTNPITSYGIQKLLIEKILYLYFHMYDLDYRIIRLANPYGPYQRVNNELGAVTNFTYKALKKEKIAVYGDGSIIRDFIYIDDAINAILKIEKGDYDYKVFNVGSGQGTSIMQVLEIIKDVLNIELDIEFMESRNVDVPINYLDISRYENVYGQLQAIELSEGILRTAEFMRDYYKIR